MPVQGLRHAPATKASALRACLLFVQVDDEEARPTPISGLLPYGGPYLITALNPQGEIRLPPFPNTENGVVPTFVRTNP